MSITVRRTQPRDEAPWAHLYAGYRAFYLLPHDADAVAATWRWVQRGEHGLVGLVADDLPVALANDAHAVATPWVTYDMRPAG
ncbi:hypothetical protein N3K63_06445 [Microbacterium sp. W1N]|uniref:hypothetical protein n=1 Tax=Microbacterium festucae TaxID=2977531 RepID=UPI0021C14942|nr:hypothetical protein [Microbacterium festucae]MCT9819927.1 hypothetical protein [Microbacterium festucae]